MRHLQLRTKQTLSVLCIRFRLRVWTTYDWVEEARNALQAFWKQTREVRLSVDS